MLDAVLSFAERVPALSFLAGVALLLGGGHWLVEGAVAIARRLGMSTLLIGLTIVACGTSAPELFFNVAAVLSGQGDLSFGNVIGSNIANLGLVLGIASFVGPLAVHRSVVRRDLPLLLGASGMLILLAFVGPATSLPAAATTAAGESVAVAADGAGYTRVEGILLLIGFVAVLGLWGVSAVRGGADVPGLSDLETEAPGGDPAKPEAAQPALALSVAIFLIGLLALLAGGKLAEIGAVGIARAANLSPALIGLTIVAVATSLPEAVTLLIALRKGHADLAVGNVVGSNLFNILFVLGTTATVGDVGVPEPRGWIDLWVMGGMTVALAILALTNQRQVLRWQSGLLLLAWASYMTVSAVAELLGRDATI